MAVSATPPPYSPAGSGFPLASLVLSSGLAVVLGLALGAGTEASAGTTWPSVLGFGVAVSQLSAVGEAHRRLPGMKVPAASILGFGSIPT